MQFSVANLLGTVATAQSSFTVDYTAPTLSLNPPNGTYVTASTVPLILSWSDVVGVDASTAQLTLDGTVVSATVSGGSAVCLETNLAAGVHDLLGSVTNVAGDTAQIESHFTVEYTPPTITLTPRMAP